MKKLSIILIVALVGISLPVFALFVDSAKCPDKNQAWDEDMKECVPIEGNYKCCDAAFEAERCADRGLEYDAEWCKCKKVACGASSDGTCGGPCSDAEDVCMSLSYRGGESEADFMGCGCCPQSLIDACEKAGGKIGAFNSEGGCVCFDAECGASDRDGFFVEGAVCGGKCSDLEDGSSQSCVEAEGTCRCCPSQSVADCEAQGGTLDEDCGCVCLLREPYPPSSSE